MVVIFDLEATCWMGDKDKQSEIIEIGAIDGYGNQFQAFVRPIYHPVLSKFCKDLTHITQEQVNNAETFDIVIQRFKVFVGEKTLVSWGNYDRKKILEDCTLWKVNWKFRHFNLKAVHAEILGIRPCGVMGALKREGFKFTGTHHRGIDDAINIAKIYKMYEKQIFDYNYYITQNEC